MAFNAEKVKNEIVEWIREWFEENGPGCNAVLGISGGKDSSVTAALCAEALGRDKVIGVLLPNGEQFDIDVSKALCEHLGIKNYVVNIKDAYNGMVKELESVLDEVSTQAYTNLAPRLRMSAIYAVAQCHNGRCRRRFQPAVISDSSGGKGCRQSAGASRYVCRKNTYRRALRQDRRGQSRIYLCCA